MDSDLLQSINSVQGGSLVMRLLDPTLGNRRHKGRKDVSRSGRPASTGVPCPDVPCLPTPEKVEILRLRSSSRDRDLDGKIHGTHFNRPSFSTNGSPITSPTVEGQSRSGGRNSTFNSRSEEPEVGVQ